MEDLSLRILDVAENAIRAHATRIEISLHEEVERRRLTVCIRDNGEGMTAETAGKACDPFFTTKEGKRVGLGLPLLRQSAEETGEVAAHPIGARQGDGGHRGVQYEPSGYETRG
jgi:signal transduction histidine kinase